MLDYVLSLPAWNPSSCTLISHYPETKGDSCSLPSPLQQQGPAHPLLDSQLISAKLKVSVTSREYKNKEMVVAIVQVDEQLLIQFSHYKMSGFLPPEQVCPKYPNSTCNNILLVVIEVDHHSKYVC
jgi:hypothetical protein